MNTSAVLLFVCALLLPYAGHSHKIDSSRRCRTYLRCISDVLQVIQTSSIFPDPKTLVDMPMKYNGSTVRDSFISLVRQQTKSGVPSNLELKQFLDTYFEPPGSEFEPYVPTDWIERPKFVDSIYEGKYRIWALELNTRWLTLFRKLKDDVRANPHRYTSMYLPYPFVIPGGRYKEQHYWQSYWIIKGLLVSGMTESAKDILNNFIYLLKKFDRVPAGSRTYYSKRTQLPLLIPMVDMYVKATNDTAFLSENLYLLEREFIYWTKKRSRTYTKNGYTYELIFYKGGKGGARPEEFRRDMEATKHIKSVKDEKYYFSQARATIETGWQMSSRWYSNLNKTIENRPLKVSNIAPVDLNSVMCWNAKLLGKFNNQLNRSRSAEYFKYVSHEFVKTIEQVFWNDDAGMWQDFDYHKMEPRHNFYVSNIAPLWTGCYNRDKKRYYFKRVLDNLSRYLKNFRGMPASDVKSGEIWDFPNMIAPLQHMVITALRMSRDCKARTMASTLAQRFIETTYEFYKKKNLMLDYYDVRGVGLMGRGGPYLPQEGFGWTNAVAMDILSMYAKDLY